jgi:tetratricopeptide (TPR) repeat protein
VDFDALATVDDLGQALRWLRRRQARAAGTKELSVREIAHHTGYAVGAVGSYLKGTTLAPTDRFDVIVQLLDATQEEQRALANARDRVADDRLAARSPILATSTLPARVAAFTGRADQLEMVTRRAMDALGSHPLAGAAEAHTVVGTYVITGMAGVGKTTLAVQLGHILSAHIGDRALFVDLHGHSTGRSPTDASDVLAELLTATGTDPRGLPTGTEQRTALWRSRTAANPVLLVLDNAHSSSQVAPLLPGSWHSLVLVTSRRRLADLDAISLPLDGLTDSEAQDLFLRLAARQVTDLHSVQELVQACGYLPLAVSLVAGLFNKHSSWTLKQLLNETTDRLIHVQAEDRSVAATLDLSYQNLQMRPQAFLRSIALHPGPDIDKHAAATLAGVTSDQASAYLDSLLSDNLISEPAYRRYRMHDLVRAYARHLADTDSPISRAQALERLLDHYQGMAMSAEAQLGRHARPDSKPQPSAALDLANREQALLWLRTERANLLACIEYASGTGRDERVVALAAGMATLLRVDGPWSRAIELHTLAADAASKRSDLIGWAGALTDRAAIHRLAGDHVDASVDLELALNLYGERQDRQGRANALTNLGVVLYMTDVYQRAANHLQEALTIYQELDDRPGQASTLGRLGTTMLLMGDYPRASACFSDGLVIYEALGDANGQAHMLNSLWDVLRDTSIGRHEAGANLQRALKLYRASDNRLGEANTLLRMGIDEREGEDSQAVETLQRALEIYLELGDRLGQANAFSNLGAARTAVGAFTDAHENLQNALSLYRDVQHRHGEVEVLNHLGYMRRLRNEPQMGRIDHHRALQMSRAIGVPLEEARALEGAGRCAIDLGLKTTGRAELIHALAIYERLGVVSAIAIKNDLQIASPGLVSPSESLRPIA